VICEGCGDELFYYEIGVSFVKLSSQQEIDDYQDGISIVPESHICQKCLDRGVAEQ